MCFASTDSNDMVGTPSTGFQPNDPLGNAQRAVQQKTLAGAGLNSLPNDIGQTQSHGSGKYGVVPDEPGKNPPPIADEADEEVQRAARMALRRMRDLNGIQSTFLTGPQGAGSKVGVR